MTEQLTVEQVAEVRRFVAQEAAGTALGREWIGRVRPVAGELVSLYSGLPAVRQPIERALMRAARLVESPERRVSEEDVQAVEEALAAIHRSAGTNLARVTKAARAELPRARNKTLGELLEP